MSTASPSSEPAARGLSQLIWPGLPVAACVLVATACGLYWAVKPQSQFIAPAATASITGTLEVTYDLITTKTPSTESSGGGTIAATRVEYFPNYVLVTDAKETTMLWPIDRLKRFEVQH